LLLCRKAYKNLVFDPKICFLALNVLILQA
jgi:hypothetical protein